MGLTFCMQISTDLSHDYTNYPDELSLVHTVRCAVAIIAASDPWLNAADPRSAPVDFHCNDDPLCDLTRGCCLRGP